MFVRCGRGITNNTRSYRQLERLYSSEKSRVEWKSTIGLEVHAQLSVTSKLFSSGSSEYGLPTNSAVNLFDAAIPGTLPILNKKAVELAVLTSLALRCQINPVSLFDRKHYFYADLPNGYQITQQRMPLAQNGALDFAIFNPSLHKKPYYKSSKIKQIQLEQDSGKSYHNVCDRETLIDLNRAGIALIEIVFEPDLEDAEEAAALVKELCFILEKAGTCSCKMEEGALRVDANVSVSKGPELGVRTEIKNIGSIRGVARAINYEISRQINILENGGAVTNQTLAWDALDNKAVPLRDKEDFYDYRFMPEPNLPPLRLIVTEESENMHKTVKFRNYILDLRHLINHIPQLPQEQRNFLMQKYHANDLVAYNIVNIPQLYQHFMDIMNEDPNRNPKSVYQVLLVTLLTGLNNLNMELSNCNISFSHLGEIVDLRVKTISEKGGRTIVEELLKGSKLSPKELVKEMDLALLSDDKIRNICFEVIENNPGAFQDYLKGKKRVEQFFINNTMNLSNSKADLSRVKKLVPEVLQTKKNEAVKGQ